MIIYLCSKCLIRVAFLLPLPSLKGSRGAPPENESERVGVMGPRKGGGKGETAPARYDGGRDNGMEWRRGRDRYMHA